MDSVEDIQDFFSFQYKGFLGSLTLAAQEKLGPPPTEFAILGLGSLGRYEASPYSDLDFAFILDDDNEDNRKYFLDLATEMNRIVQTLGESEKGINFCDGGLTPPFMQGKSTISFGSSALVDKPETMAEWSIPNHQPHNFSKRENMANPATISGALSHAQILYGNPGIYKRYLSARKGCLKQPANVRRVEDRDFTKWKGSLSSGQLLGLQLLKPRLIVPAESRDINIKKSMLAPMMDIVRGLSLYHGVEDRNITAAIKELQKQGHLSPSLAGRMIKAYEKAYQMRLQYQMEDHDSEFKVKGFSKHDEAEIGSLIIDIQQKASDFIRYKGKKNPFAT